MCSLVIVCKGLKKRRNKARWRGNICQVVSPALVAKHEDVRKARVIASRDKEMDVMTVQIETDAQDANVYEDSIASLLKLRGKVQLVAPGSLPNDGLVIEDQRSYDS